MHIAETERFAKILVSVPCEIGHHIWGLFHKEIYPGIKRLLSDTLAKSVILDSEDFTKQLNVSLC